MYVYIYIYCGLSYIYEKVGSIVSIYIRRSFFVYVWVSFRIYRCLFVWRKSIISNICVCRSLLTYMGLFLYAYGSLFQSPLKSVSKCLFLYTYTSFLVHACISFHIYRSLFIYMNESCHTCKWATSHVQISHTCESSRTYADGVSRVWMSHVTRVNGSCHTYK